MVGNFCAVVEGLTKLNQLITHIISDKLDKSCTTELSISLSSTLLILVLLKCEKLVGRVVGSRRRTTATLVDLFL